MKKVLSIIFIFLLILSFTACLFEPASNSSAMMGGEDLDEKMKKDYELTAEMLRNSFSLNGVSFVNLYETRLSQNNSIVKAIKVKSNGSTAFLFPEEMDLPSVDSVYRNPKREDDIIVVFKQKPSGVYYKEIMVPSEIDENTAVSKSEAVYYDLGQIVYIHKDGSYTSLLKKDDKETVYTNNNRNNNSSAYFDAFGNTYFLVAEDYKGDYSTELPSRYKICRFDIANNKLDTIYSVSGINHEKIYEYSMSEDLKWLFYQGCTGESHYLRAVPMANPEKYVNLVEGLNAMFDFYYDSQTKALFYPSDGYCMCPMVDETFNLKNEVKLESDPESFKVSEFLDVKEWNITYKLKTDVSVPLSYDYYENGEKKTYSKSLVCVENSKVNIQNMLEYLVEHVNKYYFDNLYDIENKPDVVPLTLNDVDIRFDNLIEQTKGKKNKEALEVIFGNVLTTDLFAQLVYSDVYFIAEIMYVKGKGNLLSETDDGKKWFKDSINQPYADSGTDLKEAFINILSEGQIYRVYTWKDEYLTKEGKVNCEKLLQYFYSFCTERGTKYFTTDVIAGNSEYSALKSNLKNEKLLEWIISSEKTMNLFYKYMISNIAMKGNFIEFISSTCYLELNGKTALPSDASYNGISYPFDFFRNEKGLFCLSSSNFLPGVGQLLDEKDNIVFDFVPKLRDVCILRKCQGSKGTVLEVQTENEQGERTGFQKLYYLKTEDGSITELLTDYENNDSMRVTSFTVVNDILIASTTGVSGIKQYILDLTTGKFTVQLSLYAYSSWLKL